MPVHPANRHLRACGHGAAVWHSLCPGDLFGGGRRIAVDNVGPGHPGRSPLSRRLLISGLPGNGGRLAQSKGRVGDLRGTRGSRSSAETRGPEDLWGGGAIAGSVWFNQQ